MFEKTVQEKMDRGLLPPELAQTILSFHSTYKAAMEADSLPMPEKTFDDFLQTVVDEVNHPYRFEPFHKKIREPFDYYKMGLELFRPLIVFEQSRVEGEAYLEKIKKHIENQENVIFLANHQAEPEPQIISLLLEKNHSELVENMIFVAGHRVVTDPLAKPFSMGRNLLCIYSKKYIEQPPELRDEKQLHNQQTMKVMGQLLAEGGKCIYVAPSGGRDRLGPDGKPQVAPFDPQSIEMFLLIAKHSGRPTHFYPLSIASYYLLPPPNSTHKKLGEERTTVRTPVHLAVGDEIDMQQYPGSDETDKWARRQKRADYICNLVIKGYQNITRD